jgi:putative addiction module CopG family antidote
VAQTRELTIQLSEDAAQFVRSKVASGEYASESEVLNESVAALRDKDDELGRWLFDVGVPIIERMKADPSSAIPIAQVERHLEEGYRRRNQT